MVALATKPSTGGCTFSETHVAVKVHNGASCGVQSTWGLDLSGTLQGAGGVGGLLAVTQVTSSETNTYFPCFDGNGNVCQYVDESGTVVAHREYSPFGETIALTGSKKDDFSFWLSTHYLDHETGLYNTKYRYYSPELGRFLSRDPIAQRGGHNIYAFVRNNPVNDVDPHGLISWGAIAAALLEGAGIVVDAIVVPDWIDDQIIDSYGGPEGFMDATEQELMSKGGALPRDMFKKARAKNSKAIDSNATGDEKALYDRLQAELQKSKLYGEKRDFIIKRLQEGTHYQGFLNIDFQDAGESSLGYAIGGAQLHYHYTEPPPALELKLLDTYDFTKKGHAWGKLQKDGYLVTYKVDVFIEKIPCPQAAPEKK